MDDNIVFHKKIPLPSWIELSIIDACNRACSFCPKSNIEIAPNTYQNMSMKVIKSICKDLKKIKYKGSVVLCGYGEPMLHKEIFDICAELAKVSFVEVVTNGDTLKPDIIKKLYTSNVNKLLISMYDGPEQKIFFNQMIKDSDVPNDFVILRDRWHDEKKDFGLKLTNRTGTINVGIQDPVDLKSKCYYPSYQMLIDWNGDVFLCPQDWQRRMAVGNVMQSDIFGIWTGKFLEKYRISLLKGDRSKSPCNTCNANGKILGSKHAAIWKEIYNIK